MTGLWPRTRMRKPMVGYWVAEVIYPVSRVATGQGRGPNAIAVESEWVRSATAKQRKKKQEFSIKTWIGKAKRIDEASAMVEKMRFGLNWWCGFAMRIDTRSGRRGEDRTAGE